MPSAVDIVNRALLGIGAKAQVSSISPSDGSTEADAAAVLFTPTFEALARTAQWNCLRKQATLSLLAAAQGTPENPLGASLPVPPTPWIYSYALPSDCLALRYVVPFLSTGAGSAPQTSYGNAAPAYIPGSEQAPYAVAYGQDVDGNPIQVVLTNQSQAQAVYTVNQPNPVIWDSQFQAAMVASLAAFLVPALNMNMQLMSGLTSNAERIIVKARISDGNEGVTVMDHSPDWMRARGSGSGWGPGRGTSLSANYIDMSWPG